MSNHAQRGFTLIELLVVISIIAMLASVVLASLRDARERASYAKVLLDFGNMKNALELYYADHNYWPPIPSSCSAYSGARSQYNACWSDFGAEINTYLPAIPRPIPSFLVGHSYANYSYWIGSSDPAHKLWLPISDSAEPGVWKGCIGLTKDNYLLVFTMPEQSSFTRNDGGIDNDSIDTVRGDYVIDPVEHLSPPWNSQTHCIE